MNLLDGQLESESLLSRAEIVLVLAASVRALEVARFARRASQALFVDSLPEAVSAACREVLARSSGVITDVALFLSRPTEQLEKLKAPYGVLAEA